MGGSSDLEYFVRFSLNRFHHVLLHFNQPKALQSEWLWMICTCFYRENNDGTNPQTPLCGNYPVMWKHPISLGYIGDMNITSHWSRWPTCWIHSFAGFVGLIGPFSVPFTRRQLRARRLWFWVLFRRRQTLIDGFPSKIRWGFFGESSRKMTKQFMLVNWVNCSEMNHWIAAVFKHVPWAPQKEWFSKLAHVLSTK